MNLFLQSFIKLEKYFSKKIIYRLWPTVVPISVYNNSVFPNSKLLQSKYTNTQKHRQSKSSLLCRNNSHRIIKKKTTLFNLFMKLVFPCFVNMNYHLNVFMPPEHVKEMKTLDKNAFDTIVLLPSIRIKIKYLKEFNKQFKNLILKQRGVKPILEDSDDDNDFKVILLNPNSKSKENVKILNEKYDIKENDWNLYNLQLTYDNFNPAEIFRAILPESVNNVSSFSNIGHILHLNLKSEADEYKTLIGQVLLDKIKTAKTIVNKTNEINNVYRNFQMELLAGEENFITTVKENGILLKMDFSKVYWNSRLCTEHERVISELQQNDVVYDVFAGIGPFAVPAAKKGCKVFANDLNPDSFKWLEVNMQTNKVKNAEVYNLDGREFLTRIFKENFINSLKNDSKLKQKIIMNLPAMAIEFLDAFNNLCDIKYIANINDFEMPIVYCYTFIKSMESYKLEDIAKEIHHKYPVFELENCQVRKVRNVAPNKDMLLLKFSLLKDIVFSCKQDNVEENYQLEPPLKKYCP